MASSHHDAMSPSGIIAESADQNSSVISQSSRGVLVPEEVVGLWTVVSFAGEAVPENGLVVHPQHGGELTIWPDGHYMFATADASDVEQGCAICYAYELEDEFGYTSVGSLELGLAGQAPVSMHEFQGWSLAGMLEDPESTAFLLAESSEHTGLGTDVPGELDLHADSAAMLHSQAGCSVVIGPGEHEALHGDYAGHTGEDELTRLLLESQHG